MVYPHVKRFLRREGNIMKPSKIAEYVYLVNSGSNEGNAVIGRSCGSGTMAHVKAGDINDNHSNRRAGCPRGVMVKAMDCGIVVSEFILQSRPLLLSLSDKYPWERYEPPYPPSYGLNSTTTVLLGEWLWH